MSLLSPLVNMVELKDLKTILEEDLVKDFPIFEDLELVLWVDTKQCKPITQRVTIQHLSALDYGQIKSLLSAINNSQPISAIVVKGYKVYRVTKTEELMNKKCDT